MDADAVAPVRTTALTKPSNNQYVSDGRFMPPPLACVAVEACAHRS